MVALYIIVSINLVLGLFNFFAMQYVVKKVNDIADFKLVFPRIIESLGAAAKKLEHFLQITK